MLDKLKQLLKNFEALDVLSFVVFNNSIWATNGHFVVNFPKGEELSLADKKYYYEVTCTDCDSRKKKCAKRTTRKKCLLLEETEFFGPRFKMDTVPIIKKHILAKNQLEFKKEDINENIKAMIFYSPGLKIYQVFSKEYINLFKKLYGKHLSLFASEINKPVYIKKKEELVGVLMPMCCDQEKLKQKARN